MNTTLKAHLKTFFLFGLALLLAACEPGGSRMRTSPTPQFTVTEERSSKCSCPKSMLVIVAAEKESPRLSIARLERNVYNNKIDRIGPTNYELSAPAKLELGCTVDRPASQPDKCNLLRTFDVNGTMTPNNLAELSREFVLSVVAGRLDGTNGGNDGSGVCLTQCRNGASDCPIYDATKSGDVSLGPKIALFTGAIRPDDTVNIGQIMALTSGGQNNCGRSDLVGVAGLFSNAGSLCEISSSMGGLGRIKITAPEALQFGLSTPQINRFTVTFPKRAGAPRLELSGGSLPTSYNGTVNRVDYVGGLYAIEVNNRCIGILTKSGV